MVRLKRSWPRGEIASRNSQVRALWAEGLPKTQILRAAGYAGNSTTSVFGALDPTPQPLGCYAPVGRAGETGEQRAFRRYPINSHKPGPT